MSVTVELLDSMLNPAPGNPGEAAYRSIPLPDRVRGLSALLGQLHGGADDGRGSLATVLLRKEIGALAGGEGMTGLSSAQAVALMGDVAEPLMSLFSREGGGERSRRQVGRCVAELCGSLSASSDGHGREWMKSLLERLEPGCAAMDDASLRLLADIAEQSPLVLWSVGSFEVFSSLFRGQIKTLEELDSAVGALTQVGIAYEKAKRVASANGKENEVEKALLAQYPETCNTVAANSPPAQLGRLLLPTMLEVLVAFSAQASDRVEALSSCMSHLSTCSEQCPSVLAGDEESLSSLMRACMCIAQVANPKNDEDVTSLRLSALDVLATVSAVPQIKRSIIKPTSPSPRSVGECMEGKSPLLQFLVNGDGNQKGVLYLCAELAVTGADGDERGWFEEAATIYDGEATWENDRIAVHAESLLESFVVNLGGTRTLPSIFSMVDSLLACDSWKNQRAVLSILERCLAAAPATFVPHVPATVDVVLRLIQSRSPRVQYQALQLLGSLCCASSVDTDGPAADQQIVVREKYGGQILEAVSHLIKSPCTKVAAHACLTIVSYCRGGNGSENCLIPIAKSLIAPYIGSLLDALRSGPLSVDLSDPSTVNDGSITVLVRAIGAVACLADATGEDFLPHYGVMSGLTACMLFGLQNSGQAIVVLPGLESTHEMATLRGSAIEAASIVGQAISGPEGMNVSTYVSDASEIMAFATALLDSGNSELIPTDQLLAACARIAAVMGSQYVRFMPGILPHLLTKAIEKVEVSIADNSGEDGDDGVALSIPGVGSKRIKINTTQLEEKAQSARALYEHARALGKEFGPFVEASATAYLPLVACEYSGDVRSTSAQALCQIFKAACLSAKEGGQNNAQCMLPVIVRALTKQLVEEGDEDDIENRYAIADALSEVMWDAHKHQSSNGERVAQIAVCDAREVVCCIMSLIQGCLVRRSTLISEMTDYSFDSDEIARCEEQAKAESEYLTHLVDSIGYQLKSLGEDFAPLFNEYVAGPLGQPLIVTNDTRARLAAMCLFDDCVEHCGSAAANAHAPALLKGIKEVLDSVAGDFELKRAALYGISQVARHAPAALPPTLGQDLLSMCYNIAKEAENVSKADLEYPALAENAVSAVASLSLFRGSPLSDSISNKGALMDAFLHGLPLEEDYDEARVCHMGLCDLVENNEVDICTDHVALIRIIGKILSLVSEDEEVASQETCTRLISIVRKIQQVVDGGAIQVAFAAMEPGAQQALLSAMQ